MELHRFQIADGVVEHKKRRQELFGTHYDIGL